MPPSLRTRWLTVHVAPSANLQPRAPPRLRRQCATVKSQCVASCRTFQTRCAFRAPATAPTTSNDQPPPSSSSVAPSSNPALAFPCIDAREQKSAALSEKRPPEAPRSRSAGPEPSYTTGRHETFHCSEPLLLDWNGQLPAFDIAYETWGTLNADRSNAILLHTGLSASSHAHSTAASPKPGWWERFIGPGSAIDADRFFVICSNVLGGCYGSTGPHSIDPANGERYATRFPILTMQDMVRAQFRLLDHLGISQLFASVGASMGGMQSLAAGVLFPDRVGRIATISGCARSHPYSIALRHVQRQVLMVDPHWARGFYYDSGIPPHAGMKLAREIATVTYRSGPEWEERFGRQRADPRKPPALCPDFLIETYLDHAGEKWSLDYDANSLLYVSKAMDLFDLGAENQKRTAQRRQEQQRASSKTNPSTTACNLALPSEPYKEQPASVSNSATATSTNAAAETSTETVTESNEAPADLVQGLAPLRGHPTLVLGVASDILFPARQQREIAASLRAAGSTQVTHVELGEDVSRFGHDTFLLDREHVGGALQRFLQDT